MFEMLELLYLLFVIVTTVSLLAILLLSVYAIMTLVEIRHPYMTKKDKADILKTSFRLKTFAAISLVIAIYAFFSGTSCMTGIVGSLTAFISLILGFSSIAVRDYC